MASVHYPPATATVVGGQRDITLLYSIPSGGDFYLGETAVAVTGVDSAGDLAQCTFSVFVVYEGKSCSMSLIHNTGNTTIRGV